MARTTNLKNDVLYWACQTKTMVYARINGKNIDLRWSYTIPNPVSKYSHQIKTIINKDDRVTHYIRKILAPELAKNMISLSQEYVEIEITSGILLFAETCLKDIDGDTYDLEDAQSIFLLDPFDTVKCVYRRAGKTLTDSF